MLVGTIWAEGGKLYNSVALLDGGCIEAVRHKVELPNYGVFDEKRVFDQGPMPGPVRFRGVRIGVPICEDIWKDEVCECLQETGSEILISPNGSPFDWPKPDQRMNVAVARVTETGLPLIYLNQVGGQDELVFDGASFVLNADAGLAVQLPAWEETVSVVEMQRMAGGWRCAPGMRALLEERESAAYHACVLGLRDYVDKNGFPGVVLGLSGGIDSALVAALATDALGAERVHCVMLPYRYTSNVSLNDAAECAKALGVRYDIVPIAEPVEGFAKALAPLFKGRAPDITEENIQSRVRGTALMAISNKFGALLKGLLFAANEPVRVSIPAQFQTGAADGEQGKGTAGAAVLRHRTQAGDGRSGRLHGHADAYRPHRRTTAWGQHRRSRQHRRKSTGPRCGRESPSDRNARSRPLSLWGGRHGGDSTGVPNR
jgi:NAD+ synthase